MQKKKLLKGFAIDSSSGTHLMRDVRDNIRGQSGSSVRIVKSKHRASQTEATGQLYLSLKLAAWLCIELIMRAEDLTLFLFPPCNHHLHHQDINQWWRED